MKKVLGLLLFLSPLLMWGQMTYLDSVNYHFGIMLNHERDSINKFNKNNPDFQQLNYVVVETDSSKLIDPWNHIGQIISNIHHLNKFYPHSTTNKENTFYNNFIEDIGYMDLSPYEMAKMLFMGFKNSPKGHYRFMIQDHSGAPGPGWSWFKSRDYKTFKILMCNSFDESMKCKWVFAATFTAWE